MATSGCMALRAPCARRLPFARRPTRLARCNPRRAVVKQRPRTTRRALGAQAIKADPNLGGLSVSGGAHPPGPVKEALAVVARFAQAAAVLVILFGERLCRALRVAVPQWLRETERNKLGFLFAAFIAGNMLAANVYKSGAFEVYYDGRLVWSKLNSGQAPQIGAIVRLLARAVPGRG